MKILYLIILSCAFSYCGKQGSVSQAKATPGGDEKLISDTVLFVPDISVNGLFLDDAVTIESQIGDLMKSLIEENDLPTAYVLNADGSQYLKLVFFPGNSKNRFHAFDVGYSKNIRMPEFTGKVVLEKKEFITENGVRLGMSKHQIEDLKGHATEDVGETMKYSINDFDKSTFLRKYNMPEYTARYEFRGDSLINYRFGFEYP